MVIQFFSTAKSFPEFYFGRREGKLFIELAAQGSGGMFHKNKKMSYAVANNSGSGLVVRRYQVTEPGTYTLRFGPDEVLSLKIGLRKGAENLYDLTLEAKKILPWVNLSRNSFIGNVSINGIKLSSLSQGEEEPSVGPTLWERLDA